MITRILLLVLAAGTCFGQLAPGYLATLKGAAADQSRPRGSAPCTTLRNHQTVNDGVYSAGTVYFAERFMATNSYSACSVDVNIYKHASETANFQIELRSDNANTPGTVLGTSSTVLNAAVSTSPGGWVTFAFSSGVSLTDATYYWVVIKRSANTEYALNWYRGNATVEHAMSSTDGSTWADVGTTRATNYRIYSQ